MKIKIKERHEPKPIVTTKPDYLTQKQWEGLKSGKQQHFESTDRANKVLAKILEKNPHFFD